MHWQRGVTLIELVMVIAILGVLATLAAPSFATFRLNASRTAAVNGLFHAVFLARSEAIKRGRIVTLCPSTDGRQCSARPDAWSDGYVAFENTDRDSPATIDPDEPILLVAGPWNGGRITSNRTSFAFRPYIQGVVNGTIVFCDSRGSAEARAIIISHTGRPRISQRDASNRPLPCSS
jgi:type IV fimbrial biogenesis protein FimT